MGVSGYFMSEPTRGSLLTDIPSELPEELFQHIATGSSFSLKRIVSDGHTTDWYDQAQNEWVLVVQGAARLMFENGEEISLQAGDYYLLPAHLKHRVCWTDPKQHTIWLALFFDVNSTAE
jgi:cupin 2 domain-containing protein